jgi:hypothetical protein
MNLKPVIFGLLVGAGATTLTAETTPLDQPLVEEKEITITCELKVAPRVGEVPVLQSAKECEGAKGVYHYKLWLPKGYLADSQKRWPCLFIAAAGGNAKMGNMAAWLKTNGYVVVMLVESKNGPWEPIIGNFLAAHDDAVKRARILEGAKVATGMSGGARASSVFVQLRPGFSGLILQAAGAAFDGQNRYHVAGLKRNPNVHVALTMGDQDKNHGEVARMKAALGGSRLRVYSFKGGHEWAPAPVFEEAAEWIQSQMPKRGAPPGR